MRDQSLLIESCDWGMVCIMKREVEREIGDRFIVGRKVGGWFKKAKVS